MLILCAGVVTLTILLVKLVLSSRLYYTLNVVSCDTTYEKFNCFVWYSTIIDLYLYLVYGYELNVVYLKWQKAICGFGCISAE